MWVWLRFVFVLLTLVCLLLSYRECVYSLYKNAYCLIEPSFCRKKAIVSNTPGTTRDTIEGKINFKGHAITFYDTAGITITNNTIEKEGIKRAINNKILNIINTQSALNNISEGKIRKKIREMMPVAINNACL